MYRPIFALFSASTFRACAIFCTLAFFPSYLMGRGLDLISSDILISAMLLAGVAGQLAGGHLSDLFGRKEYVIAGSILAIPSFYGFIFTTGIISVCFTPRVRFCPLVRVCRDGCHRPRDGPRKGCIHIRSHAWGITWGRRSWSSGFRFPRRSLFAGSNAPAAPIPDHYGRSIDLFPEISMEIMAHFINSFPDPRGLRVFLPVQLI